METTGLVCHLMRLFVHQLSMLLIAPAHRRMARLSWPGSWLAGYIILRRWIWLGHSSFSTLATQRDVSPDIKPSGPWCWSCCVLHTFAVFGLQLRETAANVEKKLKCEMSEWKQNVHLEHQVFVSLVCRHLYLIVTDCEILKTMYFNGRLVLKVKRFKIIYSF